MGERRILWYLVAAFLAATVLLPGFWLVWLFTDAHLERDEWLAERHGRLAGIERSSLETRPELTGEMLALTSSSGLAVTIRVIRPATVERALPVLLVLGGHQTGSNAVRLFEKPGQRAIVAFDYPYAGPKRTEDLFDSLGTIPAVREAFLDIAPAISLALDWLLEQDWSDGDEITLAGVSLGVPFATTAAVRDPRIDRLLLVHGAADNYSWIRHNIAREIDAGPFLPVLTAIATWGVYGPLHDTGANLAKFAPRPVIIIGARNDERVPEGQTEALFDAAREPKSLRWTEGRHVQTGRREIIEELIRIAEEEMAKATGNYSAR